MNTSNQARHFRSLAHWQRGQDLASRILALVKRLPKGHYYEGLGVQLLRSAGSVPANIAEGYGRYSAAAYRNHLSIARGSLFETQSWLDLLLRDGTLTRDLASELDRQCEELAAIITERMRAMDARKPLRLGEEAGEYAI